MVCRPVRTGGFGRRDAQAPTVRDRHAGVCGTAPNRADALTGVRRRRGGRKEHGANDCDNDPHGGSFLGLPVTRRSKGFAHGVSRATDRPGPTKVRPARKNSAVPRSGMWGVRFSARTPWAGCGGEGFSPYAVAGAARSRQRPGRQRPGRQPWRAAAGYAAHPACLPWLAPGSSFACSSAAWTLRRHPLAEEKRGPRTVSGGTSCQDWPSTSLK